MTDGSRPLNEVLAKALTNIQRIDPCANKVLMRATHTALYTFLNDRKCWEKTDVDGPFFVYQRCDKPYYSVIIANRQSLKDFIEPIMETTCVQANSNYMYIKKTDGRANLGDIKCIWFFRQDECEDVHKLIEEKVNELKSGRIPPLELEKSHSPLPEPPSAESCNLLELLKAAQKPKEKTPTLNFNNQDDKQIDRLENHSVTEMPTVLQKLMHQEQPQMFSQPVPATAIMSAEELEKTLVKDLQITAKPKHINIVDMANASSAVSLANFSTRSVHGSEFDGGDVADVESVMSTRAQVEDPAADEGSASETSGAPFLNKDQFIAALTHLLEVDDTFVSQVHQAYVDALNRRLNLDNQR